MIGFIGFKKIKGFINKFHRKKVVPVEGSVLYTELYGIVEHSGIYVGNKEISNVVVGGLTNLLNHDAEIVISDRKEFTKNAIADKSIYVSSNRNGAVGDIDVSDYARSKVGSDWYYVLHNNNCHVFSARCLRQAEDDEGNKINPDYTDLDDETWEPTIRNLKNEAQKILGATKWYIWDENADEENDDDNGAGNGGNGTGMPQSINSQNIQKIKKEYEKVALNKENIQKLMQEQAELEDYMEEISDEKIPYYLVKYLKEIHQKLDNMNSEINGVYRDFLKNFSGNESDGIAYSYDDLKKIPTETTELIREMELNQEIKRVVEKLGKNSMEIEEEVTKKNKIKQASKNQIFGIHKSNDIERILSSELILLENEELENLFYAKMYENSLLTYEIVGNETKEEEKKEKEIKKIKGPVVACIDTSGSMMGTPIFKAKSLLLSIAKELEKENRKLYVILFGATGDILEYSIEKKGEIIGLLKFLQKQFNGGTDFNTPLRRAINIIENEKTEYNKADILFITDGLCDLSANSQRLIEEKKSKYDFKIYTINCSYGYSSYFNDGFLDEIIGI